jgi:ornithine cyclodeaminase
MAASRSLAAVTRDKPAAWYFTAADTAWACRQLDPVEIARSLFAWYGSARSAEEFGWQVAGSAGPGDITLLSRRESADPVVCVLAMEPIRLLASASATVAAARRLASRGVVTVGVIGAGAVAEAHVRSFAAALPGISDIAIYDLDHGRVRRLQERLSGRLWPYGAEVEPAGSVRDAVLGADLVLQTVPAPLDPSWLSRGTVVVNVAADGLSPGMVLAADALFVDDWRLVSGDPDRVLGRLHRSGQVRGPSGTGGRGVRGVDAELGAVFAGTAQGRANPDDIVVVDRACPGIEGVALAAEVYRVAVRAGRGLPLPR